MYFEGIDFDGSQSSIYIDDVVGFTAMVKYVKYQKFLNKNAPGGLFLSLQRQRNEDGSIKQTPTQWIDLLTHTENEEIRTGERNYHDIALEGIVKIIGV